MDYEKKYKDALEKIRNEYDRIKYLSSTDARDMYIALREIFPELAESEDEKFIRGLIRGLTAMRNIFGRTTFSSDNLDITETIDWLKSLRPQPKQEWSEEDERIRAKLLSYFNGFEESTSFGSREVMEIRHWLKSLRPQPKQEWSEEDEKMRYFVKCAVQSKYSDRELEKYIDPKIIKEKKQLKQKLFDWLRDLRPQPQHGLPPGFYFIDEDGHQYYSKEFRCKDLRLKVKGRKAMTAEDMQDLLRKEYERGYKEGFKR